MLVINPAELPDTPTFGEQHGVLRVIIMCVFYAVFLAGLVIYLRWKLPGKGEDGDEDH